MPPGKRKKLEADDIALIKAWIDAGARRSDGGSRKGIGSPKIAPRVTPRNREQPWPRRRNRN